MDSLERADLSLTFAGMGAGHPERLTRGLEAGKVRLISRGEDGDAALALTPKTRRTPANWARR